MKAMILAAGLGTRLQPITNKIPKALVEIGGKALLERMIEKLIRFGYDEIIINVHHFAGQIINYLEKNDNFGIRIAISDERDKLLDTGGGIKKASWFFDDQKDFLVINVDIHTDLDMNAMMEYHKKKDALATIAVRNRSTSRYFLFDNKLKLCGWKNIKNEEKILVADVDDVMVPLAFSGIHVMSPEIFKLIDMEGSFSIVDVYLKLAADNLIVGYRHDKDEWIDLGKKEALDQLTSN